jgi:hypothetical protein
MVNRVIKEIKETKEIKVKKIVILNKALKEITVT